MVLGGLLAHAVLHAHWQSTWNLISIMHNSTIDKLATHVSILSSFLQLRRQEWLQMTMASEEETAELQLTLQHRCRVCESCLMINIRISSIKGDVTFKIYLKTYVGLHSGIAWLQFYCVWVFVCVWACARVCMCICVGECMMCAWV